MDLSPNVKKIEINNEMKPYGRAHSDGTIELNLKRGDVVDTIIHENLHLKDWDMPHGKVYETTDKIEGKMSLLEMADLLTKTHMRMQYPQHQREIMHTVSSKVVSSNIKR